MRYLGELWNACQTGAVPSGQWEYQRYLLVDNVQYFDSEIKSLTFDRGLVYNSFSLGNCISSKLNATIIPKEGIEAPINAKVILYIRIATVSKGNTAWHPFGTYYVYGRTKEGDRLSLEAYDGMRTLEEQYLDGTEQIVWPLTSIEAIQKILNHLGVELDSRTKLNPSYFVYNPEKMTMRQVLMYIGSMHGGNWYLTEENKLRMVVPEIGTVRADINESNTKRIVASASVRYDKVKVVFGNEDDDVFYSGKGNNLLSLSNPWATQEITDNIYNIINNHRYHPFEVQSAEMDPAVELGDTIKIDGTEVILWQTTFSTRLYVNISIPPPGEAGVLSEFGGDSSDLQNVYYPDTRWDFNTLPIRVGQKETQIAEINVNVTVAGNAQGMMQLSFLSNCVSDVIIRIYDNNIQELFSPIIKEANKGFNQIGIPHSYIRLKAGLHNFTVTVQTSDGEIVFQVRSVLYSIEVFSVEIQPLDYQILDITLKQPPHALEPTDIYVSARDENFYHAIVLVSRYVQGRRYSGTDFSVMWELLNIRPVDFSIEFYGMFEVLKENQELALVTEEKPYLFWTDWEGKLYAQYGDDYSTKILLAEEVVKIYTCRGWGSEDFPENDMGLVVAYIKEDGLAYCRTFTGAWAGESLLPFNSQNLPYESISCHRLNDYRMVFTISDSERNIWSIITKRYFMSGIVENVFIDVTAAKAIFNLAEPLYSEVDKVWNGSNDTEIRISFTEPLITFSLFDAQDYFTVKDANNTEYEVYYTAPLNWGLLYSDFTQTQDTMVLFTDPLVNIENPITISYKNPLNLLGWSLLLKNQGSYFPVEDFTKVVDLIDYKDHVYRYAEDEEIEIQSSFTTIDLIGLSRTSGYNTENIQIVAGVDITLSEVEKVQSYHEETISILAGVSLDFYNKSDLSD